MNEKVVNWMCAIMNFIGLVLIMVFKDTSDRWMSFGCGMVLATLVIWMTMNPIKDEEDENEEIE